MRLRVDEMVFRDLLKSTAEHPYTVLFVNVALETTLVPKVPLVFFYHKENP